jgi:hypothetical protein
LIPNLNIINVAHLKWILRNLLYNLLLLIIILVFLQACVRQLSGMGLLNLRYEVGDEVNNHTR